MRKLLKDRLIPKLATREKDKEGIRGAWVLRQRVYTGIRKKWGREFAFNEEGVTVIASFGGSAA